MGYISYFLFLKMETLIKKKRKKFYKKKIVDLPYVFKYYFKTFLKLS